MKVIGITGSIASGKSTVAQLIAKKKYPLFNADNVVSNLYNNDKFINFLIKPSNCGGVIEFGANSLMIIFALG